MFPPGDVHTSSSGVHRRHYSAPHMVASPSRRRPPTGDWDQRFTSTMNRTRSNSSSGGEVRRLSIMDYGSEGDGGGGPGGGGRAARRESFTGEAADMDFLQRQQEDNLIPLKEDLADWLNKLLGIEIGVDDFMDVLDSGVHVCKLAKLITANAEEAVKEGRVDERLPKTKLRFKENARSGTWFARDNVANFIKWCRDYGVKEECLFETEGLVSHTTPRNFVLCLLELGRMAYKYNMEAPCLVAMEKEIDRLEQGSCYGDVWSPEPEEIDSSPRESRIPVRRSSISSTVSNETHRSVSPSTARRSCSSRSTSPRPTCRSPSGRSPNGRSSRGGSPNGRSPNGRSSRGGSPSSRHRVISVTDSSVMTMRDSPRTLHPTSVGTSSRDWADGGQDAGTSMGPRTSTMSVGTSSFLKVHSTGTGMDNNLNGFSSRGTSSNGTQADLDGRRRRSSRSPSPGRRVTSNGTMTSGVDTRVNAGSNTDSPRSGTTSTSTSPDTPRRSVWRRSVSPHSTRIPVPVGTTAHGTLSHGVSSGSLNSVGSSTPTSRRRASISSNNGDTPNAIRRRSSISSTNGDTPNAIRRRSSIASTGGDTPNAIRRRSSIASTNGDTPSSAIRRRSGIAVAANGDTPKSTRQRSSMASTSNGDTPNSTWRRSSVVSSNGDTPNMVRRRSSMVSSNGDTPRPGSGTKTPRRRSMSTRSDKSDELDKEVRRISGRCECPQCYQIDRLSEGKYKIGDRVVFVRLLKGKHVMVRVGGGWDTLDHYLATHDPCRIMEVRREPSCHSLTADDDKFLFIHGKYKGHAAL